MKLQLDEIYTLLAALDDRLAVLKRDRIANREERIKAKDLCSRLHAERLRLIADGWVPPTRDLPP